MKTMSFDSKTSLCPSVTGKYSYSTISVDEFSPVIPFCCDVTGKHMKLGSIENVSDHSCVLFIEGTEMRYHLFKNDCLLCVLTEDQEFVRAIGRVQFRDDEFIILDNNNMHIVYDGCFRFYRNGTLEIALKGGETISFRLSDQGNPFVFASHGVAIDSEGYLKTLDDTFHRYHKWHRNGFVEPYPKEEQYIFSMYKGRAGITLDRKVVYDGEFITGIADPVVDISLSWAGIWALTTKGQIYLADVKECFEAVLIAENATAISDSIYEQYFIFADREGYFHIFDCSQCFLESGERKTYLRSRDGEEKKYIPKKLRSGKGRISELCVHGGKVAFRSLNGENNILRISD